MKTEFNWFTELDRAIKKKPSDERCMYLSDRAGDWPTCACGQLCKALPRRQGGEPEDLQLFKAGCEFAYCIDDNNWRKAIKVLNQIEKRTIELLKELN